jgi:iron complex outermembrane receptor protein
VVTDNELDFYNVINGENILNFDRTNKFVYKEQVAAGYVNWNHSYGKFGVQLGLRAENTHSMGNLTAMKQVNDKNVDTSYLNFFPSIAVSFTKNENNAFNLTYRHSIDRPDYQSLNPFEYQLNELLFEKGNPFLRPQYSHSFDLSYTYHQSATLSVGYARTNDYIAEVTDQQYDAQLNKYRFFVTKRNLATFDHYYASLQTPIPIKKWWNVYLNSWFNYDFLKADFGGGKIVDIQRPEAGFYMQHTFTLGKGWTAEANGNWSSGGNWGTFIAKPQGQMGIAVQKKFWDGDGTLKLAFDDIFHTSFWLGSSTVGNLTIEGRGTWEGQRVKLNFGYRFGSNQIKGARNHETGIEAEKKRVKS